MVSTSLNADQVNYISQRLDGSFDIYKQTGFGRMVPVSTEAAVDAFLQFFQTEEDIINFFTEMIQLEGKKISRTVVKIRQKDSFMRLLHKYKWEYNERMNLFFREKDVDDRINFLNSIRILDLRDQSKNNELLELIKENTLKMQSNDLEWQVTVRLYTMDRKNQEILRQAIELLLTQQNLKQFGFVFYSCLKELAINASKANYKTLFEKYHSKRLGITIDNHYKDFLKLFKDEIANNGEKNLFKMAEKEERFFNIIFKSSKNAISMWVSNHANITELEKENLLKKIQKEDLQKSLARKQNGRSGKYDEGAGLGLNMVVNMLRNYSEDINPLKVIFYPHYIKIGFELKRSELAKHVKAEEETAQP